MWKRSVLVFACVVSSAAISYGQATITAARRLDFQAGGGFTFARMDYSNNGKGLALYTTLDVSNHFGGEFAFHQVRANDGSNVGERTYEIGPRYYRTYGHFKPYVKGMYGRGVFNYPQNIANLAYNLFAAGVGVDYAVLEHMNVRADFEYQRWLSFPRNGLTPQLFTIGVAYHFPGKMARGLHY